MYETSKVYVNWSFPAWIHVYHCELINIVSVFLSGLVRQERCLLGITVCRCSTSSPSPCSTWRSAWSNWEQSENRSVTWQVCSQVALCLKWFLRRFAQKVSYWYVKRYLLGCYANMSHSLISVVSNTQLNVKASGLLFLDVAIFVKYM